jgi:Zn-dependent peptidase ImmA (M78 family)
VELTKAALSKYECDKSAPKAGIILAIARELKVDPPHFFSPLSVEVTWLAFRKRASLSRSAQEQVKARAARTVEGHVRLHMLLIPDQAPRFPRANRVSQPAEAEKLAVELRNSWKLGEGPLDSVTHAIEDHGGIVVDVDMDEDRFDGLSGWASQFPVIVTSKSKPIDRKRYNLSHELGHLAMTVDGKSTEKDREELAHRFAAAFLVPEPAVFRELGSSRRHLRLEELAILKKKYGLSISAWGRRALDLSVITRAQYVTFCKQISSRGWRTLEPVSLENDEKPNRLRQLLLRALAEGVLDENEARSEYPQVSIGAEETFAEETVAPRTAMDLLAATDTERDKALSEAAKAMSEAYATGSELRSFDAGEVLDRDDSTSEGEPS